MPKAIIRKPTEEQTEFYTLIFDEIVFSDAMSKIEYILNSSQSYYDLMDNLREKFGYGAVEDVDHYHNNNYFVPNYKSTEPDSCDFLLIGIWINFQKRVKGLDDISTSAFITVVWNQDRQYRWIYNVTIYFSKSNAYFMKPLCVTDISGKTILNWRWKTKLPKIVKKSSNKYDENSHITSIEELNDFVKFLICVEKIPCRFHAFDRFKDFSHPKTYRPYFNIYKAENYERLLNEGYTVYVKLHLGKSYDSFLLALQREIKKSNSVI